MTLSPQMPVLGGTQKSPSSLSCTGLALLQCSFPSVLSVKTSRALLRASLAVAGRLGAATSLPWAILHVDLHEGAPGPVAFSAFAHSTPSLTSFRPLQSLPWLSRVSLATQASFSLLLP